MNCPYCGSYNDPSATVCAGCGASLTVQNNPVPPTYQQPYYGAPQPTPAYGYTPPAPAAESGKGMAIAALVCGIVSIFCFPAITGALGIIFGGVAKSKGFRGGMATAGIVCGVIGIAGWILMLATGFTLF